MPTPVVLTKLFIPPPGPRVVARPRLIERLGEGMARKLTLISAPAGFGKTTLTSAWASTCGRPVAWLSLDEADGDSTRFLTHLIAALQTIVPTFGDDLASALQHPQPPPVESILTALINETSTLPNPIVLVLDDYHRIDSSPVDQAITFLLDHLPPHLHLVITTREDPQLPLARLRARDHLTEVRAADLRFAADEAAVFLNEKMGLDLPAADIATLEDRTEGWIAGLQLAALSMRGRTDIDGFIRAFTGSHRFVMDYLVDEVLRQQPERIQGFLLRTSILDQLCGPLCDAVLLTTASSGQVTLEAIERANLFLVPLDNERRWYRYHHLFADLLRQRLQEAASDAGDEGWDVATLHKRASVWHERHGAVADAIRHAIAAEDFARAADLIELAWPAVQRARQEATALGWLKVLPDDLFPGRPVLALAYVGALLSNGELVGAEDRLREVERWLEPTAERGVRSGSLPDRPIVVDDVGFRRLPGGIAVYRAGLALVRGDVPATMTYARRALELVPDDDHLWRGAAAALLGLASWTNGDLEAAYQAYADGMESLRQTGNIADVVGGSLALADIRMTQGRVRQAQRIYERGLQLALDQGTPVPRGTADMYVGLSDLARERNDLTSAVQHLQRSQDLGEHTGFPQHQYRWRVVLARIREAQGDLDDALTLLDEAERRYTSDFYPYVRPIAAMRARTWLAQGNLDDALDWARDHGLSAADAVDYLREFEHITLARVLIAKQSTDDALDLLERLLHAADAGERMGNVIEILALQALARQAQDDLPGALRSLERALTLAEPEGYVRLFVDEGPPMARLLAEALVQGIAPSYADRLLTVFDAEEIRATPSLPAAQSLVEPLSPRELDVLRLIAEGRSNREIGDRLFLALDTVKGHNRKIFGKLGVRSRTEAIARALELGLI